jgi:uncharacterized protein CbrC (UPF0167 family)
MMQLPHFKYHPDPIASQSIKPSETVCECCGEARGYIYTGPTYAEDDLDDCLCPWCIADGKAHEKFDAEFVDSRGVANYGRGEVVPAHVVEEITCRTPGFSSWQSERWWTHCGDGAEFLGPAGYAELQQFGEEALLYIKELFSIETGVEGNEREEHVQDFDRDYGPTAYVFRCRHCRKLGGYWDCC